MNRGVLELAGKLNAGVKQLVADKYIGSYLEVAANSAFDFFGSLSTTKTLSFWTSFGLRPDLLHDKCTSLTGWTVADAGSGVTDQGTYVGRSDVFRQRVTAPAASNYATVKRLSVTKKCYTAEFDLYIATHGAFASTSYPIFELATLETGAHVNVIFASDGVFFYNGSTYSNIGSVSTGIWNRWRFEVVSSGSKLQISIYKDNALVTATAADWATGAEPGYIYLSNYGYTSATTCYWDNIKISSGQNEKPLSPQVGLTEVLFSQYDDANNYQELVFLAGSGFRYYAKSGGVDLVDTTYANDIIDSDEHHVMFIEDTGVVGLYVDGQQIGYDTFASTKSYSSVINFGKRVSDVNHFNGTIRDIFIQDANTFGATPIVGLSDTITVPTSNHVPTVDTVFCVNTDGYQDFSRYVDSSASGLTVKNHGVLTDNNTWTYGNGAARFSGGTQQKIVIPNLDGDKMSELSINMLLKNAYAGANNYYLQANCDVGSNYEYTYMYGDNTTAAGQYGGALTSFFVGGANAQNEYGTNEITFETRRKGAMRSLLQKRGSGISGTTVTSVAAETQWWNTNTENLDVLVLKAQNNGFAPGSHLVMFESSVCEDGQQYGDVNVMGRVSAGVLQLVHHHEVVSADDFTKLYIGFDGNDGDTIVTDGSQSKHAITANGNFKISNAVGFVGKETSGYFDGTGDYLSIPDSADWNFSNGKFTLEQIVFRNTGGNIPLFNQVVDTNNRWDVTYSNSVSQFSIVVYSASSLLLHLTSDTIVLTAGQEYHVAVVRDGDTASDWYLFVNGTQVNWNLTSGSYAATFPDLAAPLFIGYYQPSGYYMDGWIGEVRISKGIARYTAPFTPPTRPHRGNRSHYHKIESTSLRHYPDRYTTLLIHGINGNDETDVLDSSVYNHTISCYGGARISGGFIDFDGSTGYLQIPDSEAFTFGGSDLTIDFKYTPTDYTGNQRFFSHRVDEDNEFVIMLTSSNELLIEVDSGGSPIVQALSSALSWTNGVEYHIACVRYGNVWTIYRDGVSVATTTDSSSIPSLSGTVLIGQAASGNYVNGKLRQIRVSKGIARWVTDFTPPSTTYDGEFTQAVGAELLDGDKDVLYLVHSVIASESSGIATINMRVNEDTGNNYGLQRLSSTGLVSAQRYTAQPYLAAGSANNAQLSVLERVMFASGGTPKICLSSRGEQIPASSYATEFHINGEVYNSLSPISALEFKGTLANSIGVGSEISVYVLRKR